jgi:hypothetical protein
MNIRKSFVAIAATAGMVVYVAGATSAQNLAPGGTLSPVPTTTVSGSTVVTQTQNFTSLINTYSGSLVSSVINEGAGNSLGGLTFTFLLNNNASTPMNPNTTEDALTRITDSLFSGFQTSAFYVTGTGAAPTEADRSTGVGGTVGFMVSVPGGGSSDLLVVRTNATGYTAGVAGISDGTTVNVASYAPTTAAVPEPGTYAAFLVGGLGVLGLMVGARKRSLVA